jgi:parallel beta-helix repeat protein
MNFKTLLFAAVCTLVVVSSCNNKPAITYINDPKKLQEALINAKEGDTIYVDEGTMEFTSSLSMVDKKNVTIKGKGMNKTVLSFKGMAKGTGGEGLKVNNCENVLVSDLSLRDMKGDGFKASECLNITMSRLQVSWSNPSDSSNGAYALYPVLSTNVIIEDCDVSNASDAGIYVGQSYHAIVRRNKVHNNVAGIEIENCTNVDVYENEAYDNTGGILVFSLPDIPVKNGSDIRIYKNNVHDNNLANFAPPANSVAIVPAGTGFFVMATPNVEVFDNQFINHNTVNCGIITYMATGREIKDVEGRNKGYNPFVWGISIHDNTMTKKPGMPDTTRDLGKALAMAFKGNSPDIAFDGILNPMMLVDGKLPEDKRICIRNNKGASFANLDLANNMKNISVDAAAYDCSLTPIAPYKAADKKVLVPVAKTTTLRDDTTAAN